MIATLQEPVLALADWISQSAGAPLFFVADLSFTGGDESFYLVPSLRDLILVQHRAEDNYKLVMAQTVPLGRLNADILQVLKKHNLRDYSIGSFLAQLVFFQLSMPGTSN